MEFLNWIKGFLQPQEDTIRVNCQTMPLAKWEAWRRNGGYQPCSHGGTPNPPPRDLDGVAAAPASAEMPSNELMERWKLAAIAKYLGGGEPTWHTAALLAFAEGQQQAQSLQLPPPGADPVATDEELMEELADLWSGCVPSTVRRTIYQKGRADERTAILRALGVEP
jgi:hypothetical protein